MERNILRRIDLADPIWRQATCCVDGEFLSDFRRIKAVKFNSGQYMNNTLEGGPWAPFYRAAYLTGRPFLGNIQ